MHNYNFSLPVNASKKGTKNGEGLTKLIFIGSAASGMVGIIIYGAWQVVTKDDLQVAKNDIEKLTKQRFSSKDNLQVAKNHKFTKQRFNNIKELNKK